MTDYQKKRLEIRRMKYEIEARRAKNRENRATWLKIIAYAVAATAVVAATFALVRAHNKRVMHEVDVSMLKNEALCLMIEAKEAIRRNPDNGLAKFALITGYALVCADVKEDV